MMNNSHRRKGSLFSPVVILGICLVILALYVLYTPGVTTREPEHLERVIPSADNEASIQELQNEMEDLKGELDDGKAAIVNLEARLEELSQAFLSGNKVASVHKKLSKTVKTVAASPGTCQARKFYSSASEIQMLKAYETIPFDDQDGGVWNQGFEIKYDPEEVKKEEVLKVFVVPHSHNDPGWWYTFEGYYDMYTNNILTFATKYLTMFEDMRFIYSESSFLELWWQKHSEIDRATMKGLIQNGHLEVPTGAWVMTDEANAHLYSIVTEMMEGHEFLTNVVNFKPVSHWSIDPFGLSPTVAYVLKQSNISNLVIHRVHYSVKKFLAQTRDMEFTWRQLWAGNDDKTDVFTHMFPFSSYDVPKTCGPDPKVCCQFDFRRLGGSGCQEYGSQAEAITDQNLEHKAEILYDQYRKKAQLYKTNVLLIPVGDDFRYPLETEWRDVHNNFAKLFKYMNSHPEKFNMEVKFGTLKDYFEANKARQNDVDIKTLSGDFFTYADRQDHYWSGYYTSRPFYKHMDRTVQYYVKTADILYTTWMMKHKLDGKPLDQFAGNALYDKLVQARRHLSVFQHHDGVTGTAKKYVMEDYAKKMVQAIEFCQQIISTATAELNGFDGKETAVVDGVYGTNSLPAMFTASETTLGMTLFNALPYQREEVKCIQVKSNNFTVVGADSAEAIEQEIHPVFKNKLSVEALVIDESIFDLCFVAHLPAFGFKSYNLQLADTVNNLAQVSSNKLKPAAGFDVKGLDPAGITVDNSKISAVFAPETGFVKSVSSGDKIQTPLDLNFYSYGARDRLQNWLSTGANSVSGAYLFLPDGDAKPMPILESTVVVSKGKLRQQVVARPTTTVLLYHTTTLDRDDRALLIKNLVNINNSHNFELAMRIKTDVTGDDFFTDLNGYQMIRRRRFEKLPIQAHFFPNPGSAFIEDDKKRVSLIGRQAVGVASLKPGWMEVILDRRLDHDDDRGLQEAITDNLATENSFKLLVEQFVAGQKPKNDSTVGYHSVYSSQASLKLHTPLVAVHFRSPAKPISGPPFSLLKANMPCDVNTLSIRPITQASVYTTGQSQSTPDNSAAVILQRFGVECGIDSELPKGCSNSKGTKLDLTQFVAPTGVTFRNASLTMMYVGEQTSTLDLGPMELKSVKMVF